MATPPKIDRSAIANGIVHWYPDTFAEYISGGQFVPFNYQRFIARRIAKAIRKGHGRLIINVAPRHGKSELVSRWIPIWYLNNWPKRNVIVASYGAELAEKWGREVRNEFATNPRLVTNLRDDSTAVNRWNTPQGGGMISVGVGGAVIGFGGNLVVIDDPHRNWQEAKTPLFRNRVKDWFGSTLYSRLEPNATVVLLMQRMDEDDLSGWLIENHPDPWEVIRLPVLAEANDPMGRMEGVPLCPERYTVDDLLRIKNATTATVWEAMYQQRPTSISTGRAYHRFNAAENEDKTLTLRPELPVHLSFDFNVNPGAIIEIGQYDRHRDMFTEVHEIFGPRMKTPVAMDCAIGLIKSLGKWEEIHVFGDRSGRTENTHTSDTDYQIIAGKLRGAGFSVTLKVPLANPPVKDRLETFNDALSDSFGVSHYKVHPLNCPRLVRDLRMVREDENGLIDKKSDEDLSHACLAAGTMVATDHGDIPIELVKVGMSAWTRKGFRRISHSWMSSPSAKVMRMFTEGGRSLIGTWNHPIWVENKGFVLMQSVTCGMMLQCNSYERPLNIKGKNTIDIQTQKTEVIASISAVPATVESLDGGIAGCTFRSGQTTSVPCRRGFTFTTRMETPGITASAICKFSLFSSICNFIVAASKISLGFGSICQEPGLRRQSGTSPILEDSGTKNMHYKRGLENGTRRYCESVATVEKDSRNVALERLEYIALKNARLRVAEHRELITKSESADTATQNSQLTDSYSTNVVPDRVVQVSDMTEEEPVYDLTVEDAHEFYANGILVSNSDSVGYRVHWLRPIYRDSGDTGVVSVAN